MHNPAASEGASAQELFFLYELAKVLGSSLDLSEVVEYILDGACALIGTEQGFVCEVQGSDPGRPAGVSLGALNPLALRGLSPSALGALAGRLQSVWTGRQGLILSHPGAEPGDWKDLIAAPLVARGQVQGILGVMTATPRGFTVREQERLVSFAGLAALALDNARMHARIQREVTLLRRLIQAARQMGAGQLSDEQISELESSLGKDEINHLGQAFAQMARQVIGREEALNQKVRELEIVIDQAKRDRQIAEITDTAYFQSIQQKVKELKGRRRRRSA